MSSWTKRVTAFLLYWVEEAMRDPNHTAMVILASVVPFLILGLCLSWRLQKAVQKKEKEARRKERVLQRIKNGRPLQQQKSAEQQQQQQHVKSE